MTVDVNGKRVFLCGPMTGVFAYNASDFAWAHKRLGDLGARAVFDPAYEWYTSVARGREVDDWRVCMRRTLAELVGDPDCEEAPYDMVVALDGWRNSVGARTEVQVARACGVPVHGIEEVVEAWHARNAAQES